MAQRTAIDQTGAWRALTLHHASLAGTTLAELFAADPERGTRLAAGAAGIHLDYSKQLLDDTALALLQELALAAELPDQIDALFAGAAVNRSEQRPALHPALRAAEPPGELRAQREQMLQLAGALRAGALRGAHGDAITDLVHLGIGGSDLGPRLVVSAFPERQSAAVRVHFVATLDSGALTAALARCRPQTTVFALASKSFSTPETLTNAELARQWLDAGGIAAAGTDRHWIAITSQPERAHAWGVATDRILSFPEGVGGRFSLWSAIGLPIAVALGPDLFAELLAGARAMDEHFRSAPLAANLPVLHGLLRIWQINFQQLRSHAVLPYAHGLRHLPDYLQQLVMESLGKSVDQDGQPLGYATGTVLWGSEETNGQHSFHQLLLQGTPVVPADFIVAASPHCAPEAHRLLYANCLAQSQVLMLGRTAAEIEAELLANGVAAPQAGLLAAHRAVPGNRPSSTLVLDALAPACLGALLALYEHSVFVQSAVWGINAFDQWGVELGKQAATTIAAALAGADAAALDGSTRALLRRWHRPSSERR
ncbi:MAG: glucose-6-phosphate isomerase [Porticoccaceae bacterium]